MFEVSGRVDLVVCMQYQDYVGKILPLRVTGLGLRFKGLIEVGGK